MKNKKILIPIIIVVAILILIVTAALAVLSGKENGDLSDTENQIEPVSLSSQEINDYNVSITNSIGLGRSIIGSDVYAIIDKIIESNNSNAGKPGLFISIDATAISQNLGVIGEGGTVNNSPEYVSDCKSKMETLKAHINTLKYYDIDEIYDRSRNILTGITIKENAELNNGNQVNTTNETNSINETTENTVQNNINSNSNNSTITNNNNNNNNNGSNVMNELSEQEKSIYNSSVSVYAGNYKRGVDVKSCIDAIISSNNIYAGDSGKFIALTVNGTTIGVPGNQNNNATEVQNCATQMQAQKQRINTGKSYIIMVSYGTDGYANEVSISEL